ncbi:LysE family translocator [Thermocatellispora tengchongensis]|uniref:LysE family translocator n=1 Tax=Thermocatellispora tengchongensis TaxID=1073253 RepID=UPI003629C4D1
MVSSSTLVVFVVASLALVAIPGPNHLYIIARGMAQGRAAGIASALGVEVGTMVHIAAASAGLSYLIARSEVLFTVVKLAGAAYLIHLGVRTLRRRGGEQDAPGAGRSARCAGSSWRAWSSTCSIRR